MPPARLLRVPRNVRHERPRQEQLPTRGGLPASGLGHILWEPRHGPAATGLGADLAAPAAADIHHGQHGRDARRPGHRDQLESGLLQDPARYP